MSRGNKHREVRGGQEEARGNESKSKNIRLSQISKRPNTHCHMTYGRRPHLNKKTKELEIHI